MHLLAFLPCEVVELKRQNVDVNPEYSDSLDAELFTVHLMFEKAVGMLPGADDESRRDGNGDAVVARKSLPSLLPNRHSVGKDAFEAGLDEVPLLS